MQPQGKPMVPSFFPSVRGQVRPFEAMELLAEAGRLAAAGRSIIHLSLGQPGEGMPAGAEAAFLAALQGTPLGYTEAEGWPKLREAIAAWYATREGVVVDPARIIVTLGASGAFWVALLAAFDVGDAVAMVEPCYPAYRELVGGLGLKPVWLARDLCVNMQPTAEALRDAVRRQGVKGLIVTSPSNPTGSVIAPAQFRALLDAAAELGVRVISDEIYHGISYGVEVESALRTHPEMIVVQSFSKYFRLPGWRIGWMVVPDDLLRSAVSLIQHAWISPPAPSQLAALCTLEDVGALEATVVRYAANREVMLAGIDGSGVTPLCPAQGAFYVYADVRATGLDSRVFCRRLLHEAGVVAVPGMDFDLREGAGAVRFSYSGNAEAVLEGAGRLREWLKGI